MTSIDAHFKTLRESFETRIPYTGGLHTVKPEDLVLYYDVEGEEHPCRIDLSSAREAELVALTAACQKASFGLGGKDVLDESYRKAGKMDTTSFAARFDVSGLLEIISPEILGAQDAKESQYLRAELYKLNDTPRNEDMIGSLVVIYPTAHEGGGLALEHGGKNWVFDSAAEISAAEETPALAYVAFYSDVTHAVETVSTGHRVTLTYNLFLADRGAGAVQRHVPGPEQAFERALRALLADSSFLPDDGLLGFGLEHQYPLPSSSQSVSYSVPSRLSRVLRLLKGSDAHIRAVSERVGLETTVMILYDDSSKYGLRVRDLLADDVLDLEHIRLEQGDEEDFQRELSQMGWVVKEAEEDEEGEIEVDWVIPLNALNRVSSSFIAYGNEATVAYVYGNAALFVKVPAAGKGVRA
ncbi:hypothetical protein FB45DRAFT_1077932 [Roridomyces roridus]|uniref:Prolyl 4-hydroxylase alpha subunit Fe(2+) 2OG dioxygenase domain-containing protein n=1 Tax=Roridomyces roridus TaxID=1738132 RepID=A0AAD7CK00_9AGAR|nr:hypothetical protein FB45DRAFT_1077932 [Roridomyces roridus]